MGGVYVCIRLIKVCVTAAVLILMVMDPWLEVRTPVKEQGALRRKLREMLVKQL